jgi:ornithine decarboxylase
MKATKTVEKLAHEIKKELTEVSSNINIKDVDISGLTAMITEYNITQFDDEEYPSMKTIIPKLITNMHDGGSIIDIGAIIRQYRLWRQLLPSVEVFYAVKCNPDKIILKTLANLGVGFDVASKGEIALLSETLSTIPQEKIIYANPCKAPDYIRYARSVDIAYMTFDSKDELLKIAIYHPDAKLILRILVDDITKSKMHFGSKFGCPLADIKKLLEFAKYLDLNIIGVSFHVGSGCTEAKSYSNSIERAKEIFNIAKEVGYSFYFLDIGGGFPGIDDTTDECAFKDICEEINNQLEKSFSDVDNLRVIAEPGRYFATKTTTLVVNVTSKKSIKLDNDEQVFHYYINSGIYGMFNNMVFDKAKPTFQLLNRYSSNKEYKSVIFGETCDSMDKVIEGIQLPELACGDYIYIENHGAYTNASASSFNGFTQPQPIYIFTY